MELLKRWWIVMRRRWLVVAVCLVVALVGASAYNVTAHAEYTASTQLFLRAPDVKTSAGAYQGDLFSRQRVLTYSKMFKSDDLAQRVIDRLGLTLTPQQLVSQVSASTVKDTVLMVVSVTDGSPERAVNIANAYGDVLNSYVAKLEYIDNNPDIPPLVQVVTRANPATVVSTAIPLWLIITAAVVSALVVALSLIWLLERFDTKVRSRREVEAITGSPVIGQFTRNKALARNDDVEAVFDADERFRQAALRLSVNVDSVLQRLPDLSKPPVLAVVAPHRGDGASMVARTLGRAFAERGKSVAQLQFGPESEVSRSQREYAGSVMTTTLSLAPLLTAEAFDYRLDAAREGADIVIVDSPAFSESVEAQVLVGAADVIVQVVDAGATARSLTEIADGTRVIGTPVLGVVVNFAHDSTTVDGRYL
ncbi:capsular polysaccharide biosynthesis protein [Mycolicibacterium sp. 624]|uniref:Wzz/FepE/Etk N-terminal domain-containing protein n=2 Tax=unclassified Mycolicibacterium TaxID=2636767 RepID=UPI001F4BDDEA|nr:Wzz/FepE/Etk N-terminal domain-containing protein [Mycolicibacterium sp. YH-1]UNB54383.1 Wzz/FepE/Etk N-terminal domain-containing protein [Mycolicibacterium sp. YH-1]